MAGLGAFASWTIHPPKPADMVRYAIRAVTLIRSSGPEGTAEGTGFFIADHLVVTSYHVIEGMRGIVVETHTGRKFRVERVVACSRRRDFAVLRIAAPAPAKLKPSTRVRVGDDVFTLGAPMGIVDSVSKGILSQKVIGFHGEKLLQHTAPISPGSSGGPLLDAYGEVLGINNFYLDMGQNVNFALDISMVLRAIKLPALDKDGNVLTDLIDRMGSRFAIDTYRRDSHTWNYFLTPDGEGVRRPRPQD